MADGRIERAATTLDWCSRFARAHPYLLDAVIAGVTYAMALVSPLVSSENRHTVLGAATVACGAVVCLALVVRRRWPLPVLGVTLVATALSGIGVSGRAPFLLGCIVAVATACARTNRPLSLWLGLLSVLVVGAVGGYSPAGVLGPQNLTAVALTAAAVAVGEARRSRLAYIAEVEERARRAEQSREEEASRRVAEERLRIARDLHDLVGHHIALISVQAGVAGHVFDEQPEQAKRALAQVRAACRSALDELAATISLLRTPDAPVAPTEPTVGLAQLPALTASFTAAGLSVAHTVDGAVRPIPAAVDLTAYRVIQESLTNVHKHAGPAAATVRLSYGPAMISIQVTDDGVGPSCPDGIGPDRTGLGHGILGMRERAAALGGTLRAGAAPGGGFQVHVQLPAPESTPA